ncbi:hypothetical protein [Streptomyces sp. NPDC059874]|uniref:hypothetical protein n=1 Tax=Streptomyces sp. NPDC059874 TaxID=3346983 RepID=UPI003663C81E
MTYAIGPEYWGRGLATQAPAALLELVDTRPAAAARARGEEVERILLHRDYHIGPGTGPCPQGALLASSA